MTFKLRVFHIRQMNFASLRGVDR